MTYRFEAPILEGENAIDIMIKVNAEIAIAHKKGGELIRLDVQSHSEDDNTVHQAQLQFRYDEQAA